MSQSIRQKLSSYLSLFALLINLLPPAPIAQAYEEVFIPAETAHHSPIPLLISESRSLTPVTTRPDAVLPRWFKPTSPVVDSAQTAGLFLAKPAAIAHLLEWPLPATTTDDQPATAEIEQSVEAILPAWFDSSSTKALLPQESNSQRSNPVLPGWFESSTLTKNPNAVAEVNGQPSAVILPDWFQTTPSPALPIPPSPAPADILPSWFSISAKPEVESSLPAAVNDQPLVDILPDWFSIPAVPTVKQLIPAAVNSQRSAVNLPPLRPMAAPIPQVQVNVSAPASVSAGNFQGDIYTITVRNNSASTTGFNFFITATIPAAGFIYVPGSAVWISSVSGPITYTDSYTDPLVVWTPNITRNLLPGEVVTLTFRMTTDGAALSGQRLDANAVYQNPLGSSGSNNGGTNVTVGRGNLVISKSPTVQDGTFGDVVTWTIEAANTGLGTVYSATVSDTIGSGYTNVNFSQLNVTPFSLTIGERRSFVVTATINSCNNLTNTGRTWWSIGNSEGDALVTNPATDTADIAYILDAPNISLSSNNISFGYCLQTPQTVVVTITNAAGAGPALNFRLTSTQLGSLPLSVGNLTPGWTYNGAGVFTTSVPILGGQVQTMSFVVTPTATVCGNEPSGIFTFASRYSDACNLFYNGPSTTITYTYNIGNNAPNLALGKSATVSGSTIIFAVSLTAQNIQNISGSIFITDVVPSGLTINSFSSAGLGTITQTGSTLRWVIVPGVGPGNLTGTLRITTTRTADPNNCNIFTNVVTGTAGVTCPACNAPLIATATTIANANPLTPTIAITATDVQFDHCLITSQTVVVTVTNSGAGPARNFALNFSQSSLPPIWPTEQPFANSAVASSIVVTPGSPSSGWTFISSTQRFSYTANGGVISPGQTITFSFAITPASICGNGIEWTGALEAQYTNVCSVSQVGPSTLITSTYVETDLPRFGLNKSSTANNPAQVGDIFDYIIDFTARNAQNMSDTLRITDIVPAAFIVQAYTGTITATPGGLYALTGTTVTPAGIVSSTIISSPVASATQLVWQTPISDPSTAPYTLTGRLIIRVQIRDLTLDCGANLQYTNQVSGSVGDQCPTCGPIGATSNTQVNISAPTGPPAVAAPKVAISDGQVCGLVQVTNVYSRVFVSDWNRVTFTETLGTDFGLPSGALSYVPGTLSVIISGTNVTTQVVISQTSPQLLLDFDNVASLIPIGTRDITITYNLFVSDTILAGSPSVNTNTRSQLAVQNVGSTGPCGTGDNFLFDTVAPLTLQRANLQVDISLANTAACAIVPVVLTISDPNLISNSLVANNIVVTFNVGSPDFGSISGYTYGGGFAGNPVTVTTGTNLITWTFQNPITTTGQTTGTISFSMTRSCSAPPINAGVRFADRCGVRYGDTAVNTNASPPPDVALFVTPDQFTVNENKATWRIYGTNTGAGTAGRTLITTTLSTGLQFVSYTTNLSAQVNLLTPGPFNPGDDVVWEVLNLTPNQQVRIDVASVKVVACDPLNASVTLSSGCLGDGTCSSPQSDSINFLIPPFAVRTSNAQTADLPFCDTGEVLLTVKNSSASAHIYQLVVSQTLSFLEYVTGSAHMTVTDKSGAVISGLANIPFEPVTSTVGTNTILTWQLTNPGITLSQTQILTDRAAEDLITIRFIVQTDCSLPGNTVVRSQAAGLHSCGTFFTSVENAVTLPKEQPDISLSKQGRNVTKGDAAFADTVFGEPGDVVVWRIQANNATGAYFAQNVIVNDTLPANMNTITPTASSASGVITTAPGLVIWDLGDLPADGVDRTLLVTTTIDAEATACVPTSVNTATLVYGCDNGCAAQPLTATASLQSQPSLTAQTLNSVPLNTCGGLMNVTLTNNGPPAYNVFLTDTLPSGFVYQEFITASTTPNISPTAGVTTGIFAWTGGISLPTGVTTLTFRVTNRSTTGACAIPVSGPNNLAISFDDNSVCTTTGPYTTTSNSSITVQNPNLVIDKSPLNRVADVGQMVTWTVTITNTGPSDAIGVLITDTVGSGFTSLSASGGQITSTVINTPTVTGQVITWSPAVTITAGGRWQAVVTATVAPAGSGVPTNSVQAVGSCGSGCAYTGAISDTAFVTLLTEFDKAPTVQTGTIGSLLVFTFSTSLPDVDALYQSLTLTDTLPAGLGYVSSVLNYTFDGDSSSGGPTTFISSTPTLTPSALTSGNVVWNLGNLPGTVLINGIITTVVQSISANQNGLTVTNRLSMTYVDEGQSYLFTDTAQVNIAEPILHIGKSYVTPAGCNATLAISNFNNLSDAGWSELGTWTPSTEGYYQNTIQTADRRAFIGNPAWTDYSYSFMMRTTSSSGAMGGYVRQNNAGTTDTGYRFRWTTTQMELQRRSPTNATPAIFPGGYVTGQWYHVEIRVVGSLIQVFVDGVLRLSATDINHPNGRIGLLSDNQTQTQFDDILVTRLGQQGCFVGANNLITYTLSISNQGPLPGYDLVITDAIPAGMSLVTYSLQSDDPASIFTAAPTPPVPGAANLVWNINQLTNTTPFTSLAHTDLTITVVLSVSDGITANTSLSNQASLSYDNWLGNTNPTTITRSYSGGSHSTAVQTVNGGLTKTTIFSPPPTATLGSLVTYTLIVPASPITATLYSVVITDQLNTPRFFIESVTTGGGTGAAASFNQATGQITATFASIPHDTQAFVTVTARISHEFPSPATDIPAGPGPDVITNSAVMTHSTATVITTSNVVTTNVGEPVIDIAKRGALTNDPQVAIYTLTVTNTGNSPAYSLLITDNLPIGITPTTISNGGVFVPGSRAIAWTIDFLNVPPPPANTLTLTYTARLSQAIYSGSLFTNTVGITTTSLTSTIPGVRSYTDTAVFTLTWPLGRLGDYVWYDFNYDGLQNSHPSEFPISGVILELFDSVSGNLIATTTTSITGFYIFENLPLNVTYTVRISDVSYGPGGSLEPYTQTLLTASGATTATDSNASITATFGGLGYGITTTLTSAFTEDLTLDYGFVRLVEIGNYVWFDVNNDGIQNDGPSNGFDGVTVTVTYPDGRVFTTTTTSGGYYTFTVPISQVYTITVTADNFNPGGPLENFTNTTINAGGNDALDSDGVPSGGGLVIITPIITQNDYTFDFGLIIPVEVSLIKGVTFSPPPTATLGTTVTYAITVPNPSITRTLDNVVISDVLDARLQPVGATTSGGLTPTVSIAGQTVTVGFGRINANTQAIILITAIISDPLGAVAGDTITNTASLSYTGSSGITTTNVVTTDVGEPHLTLAKTSNPPDGSTTQAGDTVTYTITIANQPGPDASIAYDLVVTDTLPTQMRSLPPVPAITLDGLPLTTPGDYTFNYNAGTGVLVITFASSFSIPVGSVVEINYTAQVDDNLPVGTNLTNQVETIWSSLPGDTPGDHDYPPLTDTTTLTSGGTVTLTKRLDDNDTTRTISGTVPYSIVLELPLGTINNLVVTDTLEAGLIYNNNPVFNGPAGLLLPPSQTVSAPNDGTAPVTIIWNFGNVTNSPANPQPIVISFTAAVANVAANVDGTTLDNDASASWSDIGGPQTITDTSDTDDVITVTVPALVVEKTVDTPQVAPGGLVTWTIVVRNVGSGTAFGVDLSDTLPSPFFTYQPNSSFLNSALIPDPTISGLDLFWDLNQTLPGFGVFTLTFRAVVSTAIPTGVFTNVASAINSTDEENNPVPPDNSGPVPPDTDTDDTDDATVLVTLLNVTKSVDPTNLTPNQVATYTIRVNNPGGTTVNLIVTDTLPTGLAYADNATPQEPDIIAPPTLIWNTLPPLNPGQSLTLTFRVTAATEAAGTYTNNVEVIGTDGSGNTVTDTDSTTVTLGTDPGIVVTKTRVTASPVAQGGQVVYNLTVQNIGDTTFFTVPLVDAFNPAHLQFVSASPAPDSTTPAGTLIWNDLTTTFGDFAPGVSQTVVVTFTTQYVPGGLTIVNAVQATGIDTNTTTVTDTDSTTVTTLSPRLDFNKLVSPTGTISPGQRLNYTICFTNSGGLTATNVVITDFVPFNTTYISGSVIAPVTATVEYQDNGGVFVGTEPITTTGLRWTLAQLPPGAGACVGFSVSVNLTISDTVTGLTVRPSPLGWIVLAGDTTGLEVISRTTLLTPTVTPTLILTSTVTPTPTVETTSTPEITATPEVTLTVTPTSAPTPILTATPTMTVTDTSTPTPIPSQTPTLEATATLSPAETVTPTPTDTIAPTDTATTEPTATSTTAATDTPTATPTEIATPEPTPTLEPMPTAQAMRLHEFLIAVGLLAAPSLYGYPAFQEPITPTETTSEPTVQPEATGESTSQPETTVEPTTPPEATPAITTTSEPTSEPGTVEPTATLTETVETTLEPTSEATAEDTLTVTPTPSVTTTVEITTTPTSPAALTGYPIVPFDTIILNIPNIAIISSDQTPTQTDVVTNPVIRIVDPLLTKEVNPTEASAGDIVTFRLTLSNPSPPSNANATHLVLVDPLPLLVDLLSYNIASTPTGLVDSVSVVTNIVPVVGHPNGITQTVATTISVFVPVLGPDQHVVLNLTTRVNNLASPPPQTIRNVAFLTFEEGSEPPVRVSVNVPLPLPPRGNDSDDDDDDDDDNNNAPPPPPVVSPVPPPIAQSTPVLPVDLLPETGLRATQSGQTMLGKILFWLIVFGLEGLTLIQWRQFKRKRK